MQQLASPQDTPAPSPIRALTDKEFLNRLRKVWLSRIQNTSGSIVFSKTEDPKDPQMQKWVPVLPKERSEEYPIFKTEVCVRVKMDCPLESIQSERENIDSLRKALTELTCPYVKIPISGQYYGETRFEYQGHEVRVLFTAWFNEDKSEQSSVRSVPNSMRARHGEYVWDGTDTPSNPSIPGTPF